MAGRILRVVCFLCGLIVAGHEILFGHGAHPYLLLWGAGLMAPPLGLGLERFVTRALCEFDPPPPRLTRAQRRDAHVRQLEQELGISD